MHKSDEVFKNATAYVEICNYQEIFA